MKNPSTATEDRAATKDRVAARDRRWRTVVAGIVGAILGRRKLWSALLMLAGVGAVAVAVGADLLGVGGQGGFGRRQAMLVLAGVASLLGGTILTTPVSERIVRTWQALSTTDVPPASLLLIGTWFGLLTGWSEAVVWFVRVFFQRQVIGMGPEFIWMVPLANLLLFVILGLILSTIEWRWPGLISLQMATMLYAFVEFWSLILLFSTIHRYAAVVLAAGLALQSARMVAKHPQTFHWLVRYSMGWMATLYRRDWHGNAKQGGDDPVAGLQLTRRDFLVGAGATLVATAGGMEGWRAFKEYRARASLSRTLAGMPNVLLIVLDTVRAQSLGLYGYERPTSPQLERLARTGVCFERAIAPAPWTLPSHASMFTGHWPHRLSADYWMPLDSTYPTLAEVLGAHGYATAGFVANLILCTYEFGIHRGFAHYEDFRVSPGQLVLSSSLSRKVATSDGMRNALGYHELLNRKTAAALNRDFLRWLSSLSQVATSSQVARQSERPFFAFLNYFDAHAPCLPPAPFDRQFGPTEPRGKYRHHANEADPVDMWEMSPAETQIELNAYEGAIAYLDHQLGLLFDQLERQGTLDNTLVIITSDHGEQFGEHGLFGHTNSLYRPALHVPLLVLPPRGAHWDDVYPGRIPAGRRVLEPVSLRDLPATVIDLIGIEDKTLFPGTSLARYWGSSNVLADRAAEPALSTLTGVSGPIHWYPITKGDMKSLIVGEHHYIRNGDGREELYDFEHDPWETRDLAGSEQHALLERFRKTLETLVES